MSFKLVLKLAAVSCFGFGIALLFAGWLLSLRLYNQLQQPTPTTAVPPPPFFYTSIGYTPATTQGFTIMPRLSNIRESLATPAPEPTPQGFTVVVGHASTQKDADIVLDELNQAGFPATITPAAGPSGGQLLRITMGQFSSTAEAKQALNTLKHRTSYQGRIVPLAQAHDKAK